MRKFLILALALLVLAAGGICFAHSWVDREKDAVTIDETALYGDKSAAAGLSLDLGTNCDYRLLWDTRYRVGEDGATRTAFAFTPVQKRVEGEPRSTVYIGTRGNCGITSNSGIDLDEEGQYCLVEPTLDVASRTPSGEVRTEDVYLKKYYEYVPLQIDFYLADIGIVSDEEKQLYEAVAAFFKIPVGDDYKVRVSVTKDRAGNIVDIENETLSGGTDLYFNYVMTEDGCYLAFSNGAQNGEKIDTGHIPGGYGIYFIPFIMEEGSKKVDAQNISTVFPVDEQKADILGITKSADGRELLLITEENGTYMLTTVDIKAMAQRQKLDLILRTENTYYSDIKIYEDFLVTLFSDGQFVLFSLNPNGLYEKQFEGDMLEYSELGYKFMYDAVMDFDGERLAVAALNNENFYSCSFFLAVYDKNGLMYFGEYAHSSDRILTTGNYQTVRPNDLKPLTVSWDA